MEVRGLSVAKLYEDRSPQVCAVLSDTNLADTELSQTEGCETFSPESECDNP